MILRDLKHVFWLFQIDQSKSPPTIEHIIEDQNPIQNHQRMMCSVQASSAFGFMPYRIDNFSKEAWDAGTRAKQYTFEGHEEPVYFVCPYLKENIQDNLNQWDNKVGDGDCGSTVDPATWRIMISRVC
ncbi:hypothetical protein Lser_V15G32685 [Lactuca serriola]